MSNWIVLATTRGIKFKKKSNHLVNVVTILSLALPETTHHLGFPTTAAGAVDLPLRIEKKSPVSALLRFGRSTSVVWGIHWVSIFYPFVHSSSKSIVALMSEGCKLPCRGDFKDIEVRFLWQPATPTAMLLTFHVLGIFKMVSVFSNHLMIFVQLTQNH